MHFAFEERDRAKNTCPLSSNANRRWQLAIAGTTPAMGRKATAVGTGERSERRGVPDLHSLPERGVRRNSR
jgi:hypothetical protein